NRREGFAALQLRQQLKSIKPGHLQVGHDQPVRARPQAAERLRPSEASSTSSPILRRCRTITLRTLIESSTTRTAKPGRCPKAFPDPAGSAGSGGSPSLIQRFSPEGLRIEITSPLTERLVPEITGCPARSVPSDLI